MRKSCKKEIGKIRELRGNFSLDCHCEQSEAIPYKIATPFGLAMTCSYVSPVHLITNLPDLNMTERELINGILKGEEAFLRRFYKLYSSKLLSFIRKKIGDEKDVEEIFQDTLMGALESFRDFTFRSSVGTFLCAIAKRKIADFYRKRKIAKILFSQIPEIEPLFKALTTPEDKLDEKILKHSIEKTMQALKPKYKKILKLKYIDGFSVLEIAKKLSVSFKSAESMLFRARREFAEIYQGV